MAKNKESGGGNPDRNHNQGKSQNNNQNRNKSGNSSYEYPLSGKARKDNKEHQRAKASTEKYKQQKEELDAERSYREAEKKMNEDYPDRVKKQESLVVAEAIVGEPVSSEQEAEKIIEVRVEEVVAGAVAEVPKELEKLEKDRQITSEQAKEVQLVLQSPEANGRVKNFLKSLKESAVWGGAAGLIAGVAAKGAIRGLAIGILGGSLPVILGAGAAAGGVVEGARVMWRESKRYNYKESIAKLESEPDQFKKAAILNKLELAHKEARFNGDPEDLRMAAEALARARTHFDSLLRSKDTKFEKESDRSKLEFLLDSSVKNRKSLDRTTKREANQLLKEMDRSMSERNLANLKGRWNKVAWAAAKGATFGMVGAGVGYAFASSGIVDNALGYLRGSASGAIAEKVEATAKIGKEILRNSEFSEAIGPKGITGAYREMARDYIIQQRVINPEFAANIKLEHLVYIEDYLKDAALAAGTPTGEGVIKASGAELQQAIDKALQLDDKGVENIRKLIDGNKHHISKAVREHMLNWGPDQLSNPDNSVIEEIGKKVSGEISNKIEEPLFGDSRFTRDLITVLATNAIVEEAFLAKYRKDKASKNVETGTLTSKSTSTGTAEVLNNGDQIEDINDNSENTEKSYEKTEAQQKALEKAQNKLESAGIKVHRLDVTWLSSDKDSELKQIDIVTDQLISSFEKYSGKDQIKPVALIFNFKEGEDVKFKHQDIEFDAVNTLYLEIPMYQKKSYYKEIFRDFFKEYSISPQPDLDADSADKEEESEPIPKPTEPINPEPAKKAADKKYEKLKPLVENKEQKMAWSEFNDKYTNRDELIKVDLVKEATEFKIDSVRKKINKEVMYNKIDALLQQMKEKGNISKEQWGKLKGIEIVSRNVDWQKEAKPNVLYIEGESVEHVDLNEPDDRGHFKAMWQRQIERIP